MSQKTSHPQDKVYGVPNNPRKIHHPDMDKANDNKVMDGDLASSLKENGIIRIMNNSLVDGVLINNNPKDQLNARDNSITPIDVQILIWIAKREKLISRSHGITSQRKS